ncbi:MAG: hypothetical protein GXY65_15270 [Rhodococcus sp.]|uniref:hypothetical protein n=1 Tax=Rhodococcus TaxID=1827 RepID=UPI00169B8C21|nr:MULTISPECIES: hypothetical protein [Rhodococcus]NLV80664.1 hypothetical protein [Rhodococcus sp. (in: high G+C Gram-positive bacteria)]
MKRAAVLLVALIAVGVAVVLVAWNSVDEPRDRSLDDSAFLIHGRNTTCSTLFGEPCEFALQAEFNQRGRDLEEFVETTDFGPWGNALPFADAALLSLQACMYSGGAGKTELEFVELGRRTHPDAGSVQLFPFWNRARQGLCPMPWL